MRSLHGPTGASSGSRLGCARALAFALRPLGSNRVLKLDAAAEVVFRAFGIARSPRAIEPQGGVLVVAARSIDLFVSRRRIDPQNWTSQYSTDKPW